MGTLEAYRAIADESRLRIVHVLSHGLFNVQELTHILALSQPTVSHHLKTLQSAGIVRSERNGTFAYYSLPTTENGAPHLITKGLLSLFEAKVCPQLVAITELDLEAIEEIQNLRRDRAKGYFDSVAGEWQFLRQEAQGDPTYMDEVIRHIPSFISLLELGCGSGALLERLLPRKGDTIGVDYSEAMLAAAKQVLKDRAKHVDLRLGYLEHLPVADASVDVAVSCMVLHHIANPKEVMKDTLRVLKSGGKLLIADLTRHTREEMRERFADLWLGFDPKEMEGWAREVGFHHTESHVLPGTGEVFLLSAHKH